MIITKQQSLFKSEVDDSGKIILNIKEKSCGYKREEKRIGKRPKKMHRAIKLNEKFMAEIKRSGFIKVRHYQQNI